MAWPLIIRLGGELLKIGSSQLPRYLSKGAKLIKKPSTSQIKKAQTPNKWAKKQTAKRGDEHVKRVKKESKDKYIPKRKQPEGIEDLLTGDSEGESRFWELEHMDDMESFQFDPRIPRKRKGGSVKGSPRGIGKALRGGGAVTRS